MGRFFRVLLLVLRPFGYSADVLGWRDFVVWILALVSPGVLGVIARWRAGLEPGIAIAGSVAFLVLLFFLSALWAAYRLQSQLDAYAEKQALDISIETSSVPGQAWLNLRVDNPNRVPIASCYGKIRNYRAMDGGELTLPRPGHRLPWRSWSGTPRRLLTNIPARSEDYLDLAVAFSDAPTVFCTPTLSEDDIRPIRPSFPLPVGTYEVEIEIGSELEGIKARLVKAIITFHGDLKFDFDLATMD